MRLKFSIPFILSLAKVSGKRHCIDIQVKPNQVVLYIIRRFSFLSIIHLTIILE